MPHIVVENLVKTYRIATRRQKFLGALRGLFSRDFRVIHALDRVSFSIEHGEIVGYIGPNGAGKSTTVKILAGILVPDSGKCLVEGRTPWKQRIEHVSQIGVVFGQRTQLWWDLPVRESFTLLKDLYRIETDSYEKTRRELIERLQLEDLLDVPVRQLSLGQRMRCDLAAAFLHAPKLVYLDEPTIGLDAVSKLAVREFLQSINQTRQTTILLTTHDMDDIEALCSRVIVIGGGKILSDGTLNDLRAQVSKERYLIVELAKHPETFFVEIEGVFIEKTEGKRVFLRFTPEKISAPELIVKIAENHPIQDLFVENLPIEEIISQLYQINEKNLSVSKENIIPEVQ